MLKRLAYLLLIPLLVTGSFAQDEEPLSDEELAKQAELMKLPNLVLIIADDLAWDDSSPYGHDSIMTPNLQRLANEGMRFDNAFVTTSSCSPSRASIITGRYPHQTDAEELHWPVPKEQITFVEKLREKGYWTAAAGKWHMGDEIRDRFDEIREVDTSGFQLPSGDTSGKFKETLEGEAQSGCADWVPMMRDRPAGKPFFLWLAALDPHRPYHSRIISDPSRPDEIRVPPYHPDTPAVRADYQLYYDEVTRLDRYVGLVMDELEAQGVADNTLILFISDNGRPFPRDKTTLYDSGIRTPWLVKWPAKVEAGTVCRKLVSTVDIARTFMRLGGIGNPGQTFEGVDFSPLFTKPDKPIRDYVYAEKNWHDFEDHVRAVRNERYKYIRNYYDDLPQTPSADGLRSPTYIELLRLREKSELTPAQKACFTAPRSAEELYDTKLDIYETNNLVDDERFAPLLRAMRAALRDWEKKTKDAAPELRTADEFDRVTGLPTDARVRPRLSKAKMLEKGLVAP
ncbi:MAG: sulfatase [Verrucomicrobiales bacterium]|nr:sulfatase [Verrucomicrobiales bacterium]